MFKALAPLNRETHRGLRLNSTQSYQFAAGLMAVPIVSGEALLVARDYPIIFGHKDDDLPLALLGVQPDVNAYLLPNGQWQARYIPAHIRRYPFTLARGSEPAPEADKIAFTIMIDSAASQLSSSQGTPLFTDTGDLSPLLQKVQEFLLALERDSEHTLEMVRALAAADLLIERVLRVQPKSGKGNALKGLRVIDTAKFAALPVETLQTLKASGALLLVYAHLLSLANLQDGPLQRGERKSVPNLFGNAPSFDTFDWSKLS